VPTVSVASVQIGGGPGVVPRSSPVARGPVSPSLPSAPLSVSGGVEGFFVLVAWVRWGVVGPVPVRGEGGDHPETPTGVYISCPL